MSSSGEGFLSEDVSVAGTLETGDGEASTHAVKANVMDELRASERRYRLSFERNPGGLFHADFDGRIIDCNASLAGILGYQSREELLLCYFSDFYPEASDWPAFLRRLLEPRTFDNVEARCVRRDGSTISVFLSASAAGAADGMPPIIQGTLIDVPERRLMEEALRTSEERYRTIIETIEDAYWETDIGGNYTFFNECAVQLQRRSREELMGLNNRDYMDEETAKSVAPIFREIFSTGQPAKGVGWEIVRGDGVTVSIESNISLIRNAKGEPMGFRGISRDVTERKRMEQQLRRSQMSLAQAQQIARLGNWDWDLAANEIVWSDEVYRILGFIPREFPASTETFYNCIHIEDRGFAREAVRRALTEKTPYNIDHRVVLPDGSERFVNQQGEIVFDESGKRRLIGTVQDITERKKAERTLREFAAKLERSNRELDGFSYVASHDLQEPLRKIRTFGNRMATKYAAVLGDHGRDYLERIQNAAARMQLLIDALLSYSRITTLAQPFVAVNLNNVVQEVVSDLEVRIEETRGHVEVGHLPTIDADPVQMHQLFQNLIGNALKFHREDEPRTVKVYGHRAECDGHSSSDQELCNIIVEDNGIGFDSQHADRIFAPFQRLHGRDAYEGAGIGLSTCRKIVEHHGGAIIAKSELGKGSEFIVQLPLRQRTAAQ